MTSAPARSISRVFRATPSTPSHTPSGNPWYAIQPADRPPARGERRATGPEPLLPSDGREEIVRRLGHAVNAFADNPRDRSLR